MVGDRNFSETLYQVTYMVGEFSPHFFPQTPLRFWRYVSYETAEILTSSKSSVGRFLLFGAILDKSQVAVEARNFSAIFYQVTYMVGELSPHFFPGSPLRFWTYAHFKSARILQVL